MNYFDLYTFIGKDIVPPGGTELTSKFMDEIYFFPKSNRFSYLEIASHTGALSRKIATLDKHNEIYGIDISSFAINRANKICERDGLRRIKYLVSDAEELPFEDDYFDFVDFGIAVGFFIQNRNKCLEECKRVLKKDGRVFFNSLFYVNQPPDLLTNEVERILGITLDRSIKYDYNFFLDLMSDSFELEKELIIEFDGSFKEWEFENHMRSEIKNTDAAIAKLSPDEQEIFIKEYAESRFILQMNEEYCLSALQAWKVKD